ncbi:MAG: DUF1549 domain-containing protein, partial [Verrucomicrobiae bacterium]|nr:DUF1549 domain-containing protein [Verrucomicrobiae bacterium]
DSTGRAWNAPLTYAFRYRDYVIDSFQQDTPYDRFLVEQLAGDLLPADNIDERRRNLVATGFLAIGSVDIQSLQYEQFVLDRVDDQIDVTTRALLGLSVSCARCHDHKYDPITLRDYYALAGIFYSARTFSGTAHKQELGAGMYVDPERMLALPVTMTDKPTDKLTLRGVHSMTDIQEAFSRGIKNAVYDTHRDLAVGVVD